MKKGVVIVLGLLAAIAAVVVMVLVWAVGVNNKIVRLNQDTDSAWAQVQTVYQRRADLIPNLVSTVQGAANLERNTLNEVTQARASVGQVKVDPSKAPTDPEQLKKFQAAQDQLSSALSRLLLVAENYPQIRSTESFRDLQTQLEGTENRISVERGRFNEKVRDYNTYIQQFPGMFIASFRNFRPKSYFTATEGSDRPPKVQFDFNKSASPNAK